MSILERIHHFAMHLPDRPAHISGERSLGYAALWRRSDELAAWLLAQDGEDRSPVLARGHKEPEMLVAFLAAVKCGRPYVPVDISIPEERVRRIIASAGARRILDATDLPEGIPGARSDQGRFVGQGDVFYIIYTSGSTGEPKGVQITRSCLESFVNWMLAEHKFSDGNETFLNQAPFSFDLSVMDLYLSLVTGGTLVSLDRALMENQRRLFLALPGTGVTTWVSTPSFARMCLAEPTFARTMLPEVRRFLFCGETLPGEVAGHLLDRFPGAEVWNTYGPTEATVATTSVRVDRAVLEQYDPLPVGYPKPDTSISVVGEDGLPVPEGERGEIIIAGPNVSPGYLNNPEQTARAFSHTGPLAAYRTGDWGRFHGGLLFFEGRMDFQIKLHGYRIELGDIEAHLRALPAVGDAVVVPALRDGQPSYLAAFVILKDRQEGSDFSLAQALRQALGDRVPAYMVPRKFFFPQAFPMTPNGKADRRKLGEMLS